MIQGDSRKKLIPPTCLHVKAGFVVYSPDQEDRNIIILNDGELVATDKSNGLKKTIFKMQPGDLVGVAALLEREPFKYTIEATRDSTITLISESCMESELKTLPLWLLAVIKNLSAKTRKLKESTRHTRVENTLKSLAEFISHLEAKKLYPLEEIVQEFRWQTKISEKQIKEDIKALARRRFIDLKKREEGMDICSPYPMLLQIFVDYQKASEKQKPWAPFNLSLNQKKILVMLSSFKNNVKLDAPNWIRFFEQSKQPINVTEWLKMLKFGWFNAISENQFEINKQRIQYYLLALRYETNIRGVL